MFFVRLPLGLGMREAGGHAALGTNLDRAKRLSGCSQGSHRGILDLVVVHAIDVGSQAFSDRLLRGGDLRQTLRLVAAPRHNPQRDRRFMGGDPDERITATADQIGKHLLDRALPGPEALDAAMHKHTGVGLHDRDRRFHGAPPHHPHL